MAGIIVFGLGEIGSGIARLALERGMEIKGAVDMHPDKAGRDLGEVLGTGNLGIAVSAKLEDVLSSDAGIVVNSTISSLERLEPDIIKVINARKNLISTCEELAYPHDRHPEIAARIDRLAREKGVSVMGAGVNPGFVMDRLVLTLAGTCSSIRKVRVVRVVNTSERRLALQKKTGAGMSPAEFAEGLNEGRIRHVGLTESLRMVADGLGIRLDKVTESIEPVIAEKEVRSSQTAAKKGTVSGLRQVALGMKNNEPVITLELMMHLGAESYDSIEIEGIPRINVKIEGGIHGDFATIALIVNSIPRVMDARPGLLTAGDFA